MVKVAVTAFGADRPGMVAVVTGVLMDHGGNLEDTAMTNLGGLFAMMLIVEVPTDVDPSALETALAEAVTGLDVTVSVRPVVGALPSKRTKGTSWAVNLYGADRPGIVHRVARLLADHGANIVDLTTRVVDQPDGGGGDHAYVMLLEITLPGDADVLAVDLEELATDLGVEIHLRPDEADIL